MPIIPMWSGKTAIAYSDAVGDVKYDLNASEIAFKDITVTE